MKGLKSKRQVWVFFALATTLWAKGAWLPENASTIGDKVDHLYTIIFALTAVIFFLTEGALIFFIVRYRARPGRQAFYFPESNTLELIWWIVPGCILFFLALYQWNTWALAKRWRPSLNKSVQVEVWAQQFSWSFRYRGLDKKFGTQDDIVTTTLYVPLHVPVSLQMRSPDVIHSFYVPAFRIKQDIVPGSTVGIWFEAKQLGRYEIACAELCGVLHYAMRAEIDVLEKSQFKQWLAEQVQKSSNAPFVWGWRWAKETL